ncbi:MAG: serine hydrolase domain-containing protein [Saprospiraceae bacterium]|nr:beta-lactamase family protein [Lewinella sp.]
MNRLFLLLVLLVGLSCKSNKVKQPSTYSTAIEQARKLVQETSRDEHFPGIAVAVSVKGELVWSEGFGYADIAQRIPVDPARHLFRIGSISKSLTASGLAKLYEEGKVDLDAPIQTYVPSFPEKEWPITLRQLGGHLAGIRHYQGNEFLNDKKYETVLEGLDIFKNDPLLHEPGSKYAYSSYGWNLISAAMENISGQHFLKYMEHTVFKPLKLNHTIPDHADEPIKERVKFYELNGTMLDLSPYVDNSYKWAGGGFLSTAEDMIRFGNAHLHPGFLNEETWKLFTTSQVDNSGKKTNYGIGWRSGEDNKGRPWFGHSGGSVGGTSYLLLYPDQDIVVVTLVNLSSAKLNNLPFRIANQFLSNE